MNKEKLLESLKKVKAVITDSHLVYTSGRHGSHYVNKDAIYPHTELTSEICEMMAVLFKDENVEVVAGPTVGGVILAQWVAHFLSKQTGREVLAVFAEEDTEKNRFFKRGYDKLIQGKRVLVVEDILTTGGSVKKVVEAVRASGGEVVGVAALCNRGSVTNEQIGNVPKFEALLSFNFDSWEEADCPLCKKGVEINIEVGKGREYLKNK